MSLDKSLFVSDSLHERTIKLADGTEHVLNFKELPAQEFRRFAIMERSSDDEKQSESMSRLIASSLCDKDGKPALTVKQAGQLKSEVANAIVAEILLVNGIGLEKKA